MSRRTETAYKAQSPGELAQHNEARDSGDRVVRKIKDKRVLALIGKYLRAGVGAGGEKPPATRLYLSI